MPPLVKYLANLGYGSRREVTRMVQDGQVTDPSGAALSSDSRIAHADVRVGGEPLDPPPGSVIVMHKPLGYVCSTTDAHNPVVYDLLPSRFRARSPIVAPVGRLDLDTSGLLLLTDDGAINHRLTSPRSHLPKTYLATLAEPLRGDEAGVFASGTLHLQGDVDAVAPAQFQAVGERIARVILTEGRYHQVRRMFAAVGHHVHALERIAVGTLTLGDLPSGAWRVLTEAECALLTSRPTA